MHASRVAPRVRRACSLLVLVVLASGCLGAIPARVPILLVETRLLAESEGGGGSASYDRGHHCDRSTWSRDGPEAHLEPYGGRRPGFVVIRPSEIDPNGTAPLATFGGGFAVDAFPDDAGSATLRSLVAGAPPVAEVSWSKAGASLDGAALEEGRPVEKRANATVNGLRVEEAMTFTYLGVGKVTTARDPPWAACR